MSELHNEDYILQDDDDIINDDSPDVQRIEEFERQHISQEDLDFITKTCKQ